MLENGRKVIGLRLDKYLCDMGIGTRSEVKSYIKKGGVCLNDEVVTRPETKVDPGADTVTFDGRDISYSRYEYYMFHKPAGCVTATEDNTCKTVMDYLTGIGRAGFFPVGRLDKDTEGLLLITNDGEFSHRLMSPKKHIEKKYYAVVTGTMPEDSAEKFAEGIDIGDDKRTLPARLEILSGEAGKTSIYLTITEGRYHQVKRMIQAVGCRVVYLKRISIGSLELDEALKPGEYRRLTQEELGTFV